MQIDTNVDPTNPLKQKCERLDLSIWRFPTDSFYYLKRTDPRNIYPIEIQVAFASVMLDTFIGRAAYMQVTYPQESGNVEANVWGNMDQYWLVTALDGGIYTMQFESPLHSRTNFKVTSIYDSPRIFLPPTLQVGTVWRGGLLNTSTMITEADNETSPGLISGCFKFSQRNTYVDAYTQRSIALNWWYLPGSGFVDRYNMDTRFLHSRTPFSNG